MDKATKDAIASIKGELDQAFREIDKLRTELKGQDEMHQRLFKAVHNMPPRIAALEAAQPKKPPPAPEMIDKRIKSAVETQDKAIRKHIETQIKQLKK